MLRSSLRPLLVIEMGVMSGDSLSCIFSATFYPKDEVLSNNVNSSVTFSLVKMIIMKLMKP